MELYDSTKDGSSITIESIQLEFAEYGSDRPFGPPVPQGSEFKTIDDIAAYIAERDSILCFHRERLTEDDIRMQSDAYFAVSGYDKHYVDIVLSYKGTDGNIQQRKIHERFDVGDGFTQKQIASELKARALLEMCDIGLYDPNSEHLYLRGQNLWDLYVIPIKEEHYRNRAITSRDDVLRTIVEFAGKGNKSPASFYHGANTIGVLSELYDGAFTDGNLYSAGDIIHSSLNRELATQEGRAWESIETSRNADLIELDTSGLQNLQPYLYVKGNKELLGEHAKVVIVGPRTPDPYNLYCAQVAAEAAVDAGLCVVCGLEKGVGEHVAKTVLSLGGKLAIYSVNGLNEVFYPSTSSGLLDAALQGGGGVLLSKSEDGYYYDRGSVRMEFTQKNEYMALLSDAVVVCGGGFPSAAVTTVDTAIQLNKHLMAFPGNITSKKMALSNMLLETGRADYVGSYSDIKVKLSHIEWTVTQDQPDMMREAIKTLSLTSILTEAMGEQGISQGNHTLSSDYMEVEDHNI